MNNQEESRIVYVRFEEWLGLLQSTAEIRPAGVELLRRRWNDCSPMVPWKSLVVAEVLTGSDVVHSDNLSAYVDQDFSGILVVYTVRRGGSGVQEVLTVPSVPSPHTQENEVRTCEDLHSTPEAPCQMDTARDHAVDAILPSLLEVGRKLEDLLAVCELQDIQMERDRAYFESRLDYLETTVARVLYPSCDKPRKKSKKARASSKTSGRRPVRKGRRAKA